VRDVLAGASAPEAAIEALERLTTLSGDVRVLDEAERAFAASRQACEAIRELRQVAQALEVAGLGPHLAIDLGEVRGLDYYTGLVFRVFAADLGFEVGAGGRYDGLLARFGRPMPAVGFMLGLDRLALLLERQGTSPAHLRAEPLSVHGGDLGSTLRLARERRASGARVRFGNGNAAAAEGDGA